MCVVWLRGVVVLAMLCGTDGWLQLCCMLYASRRLWSHMRWCWPSVAAFLMYGAHLEVPASCNSIMVASCHHTLSVWGCARTSVLLTCAWLELVTSAIQLPNAVPVTMVQTDTVSRILTPSHTLFLQAQHEHAVTNCRPLQAVGGKPDTVPTLSYCCTTGYHPEQQS